MTLVGALTLSSVALAQTDASSGLQAINTSRVQYRGVYDVQTGQLTQAVNRGTLGDPIYANTALSGFFYGNAVDTRRIFDEGTIPRPSTAALAGTQESYDISSLGIFYVTDATDPSLGGTGIGLQIELYESWATCAPSSASEAPIAVIDLTGLPGSMTPATLEAVSFDVDLTSMGICMRAEGRDGTDSSAAPTFGWSMKLTDIADGTGFGPLIAGDPLNVPEGDGTVFQNPMGAGTGLGSVDAFWREEAPGLADGCLFFGGYPANIFGSFALEVRSSLSGDCIGCGIGDDRFEENDDAMTAAPVELGFYAANISDAEDDWFEIDVAAGDSLQVDIFFVNATSDLDLRIFDSVGTQLDSSTSTSDQETVSWLNCGAATETVSIRVQNFSGVCSEYDLLVAPGSIAVDDALEDNDSCGTAVPLPTGLTRDLVVLVDPCSGLEDSDYYSVNLPDGNTLAIDILFDDAAGDLDLFMYDSAIGCDGGTTAPETLDFGFSSSDNESVRYTNTSGAALDIIVRVDSFGSTFTSNTYDMVVTQTGFETFGELICAGEPHSAGDGARLRARGSDIAADNNLRLQLRGAPGNVSTLIVASQDVFNVQPAGSDGVLCIASLTMARFLDSLSMTDIAGSLNYVPDIANVPFESAGMSMPTAILAGDTLNFQAWFRDGTMSSNFSDALSVTFQ